MPNWTSTSYRATGSPQGISKLYKSLQKMNKRKNPKIRNGFGPLWLGELLNELGGNWEDTRCRGEITWFEKNNDGTLSIDMICAWCEQSEFRHWLEGKLGLKIYYRDEEPGCEVYNTNDSTGVYFPERYYLNTFDDPQYFDTIEEAAKYVADLVGKEIEANVDSINEALESYMTENDDDDIWFSFHEFTILDD